LGWGWIGRKCFADNHLREKRKKNDAREYKNEERGEYGKNNGKTRILATKTPELFAKKMGLRRKRRFVVLPTCATHLYKFEFIHMALSVFCLIKYRKLQ
jgi:hypothetical protein